MSHGKSFSEIIEQTAVRKLQAAHARFSGNAQAGDSPRDIYASACRTIGEALRADEIQIREVRS